MTEKVVCAALCLCLLMAGAGCAGGDAPPFHNSFFAGATESPGGDSTTAASRPQENGFPFSLPEASRAANSQESNGQAEASRYESRPEDRSGESQYVSGPQEPPEPQESSRPEESLPEIPQGIPETYEDEDDWLYGIESEAAILVKDGVPIAGKHAEDEMYPASITKLVTALVAYEYLDMDETVEMTEDIVSAVYVQDLSIAGFLAGDEVPVRDYMYGLLVPSGAECALMLAELVAGSEEAFAEQMNAKAEELGMTGSHFTNPYGAHDDDQYITALDASKLLAAALEIPLLYDILTTSAYTAAPSENYGEGLTFYNVISYYLHGDADWPFGGLIYGGKTGTTTQAGKCLASFSKIGGNTYILVTLGARGEGSGQIQDALLVYGRLKAVYEPEEDPEEESRGSEEAETGEAGGDTGETGSSGE